MLAIQDPVTKRFYLALMPKPLAWYVAQIWGYEPPRLIRVKEVSEKQALAFNTKALAS